MSPEQLLRIEALGYAATRTATAGATEQAVSMFQLALQQVVEAEAPELWARLQHNYAETLVQRTAGVRQNNLERAITAYRAALAVRRGSARAATLFGLAQALRQRCSDDPAENDAAWAAAIEECQSLVGTTRAGRFRVERERALYAIARGALDAGLVHAREAAGLATAAERWLAVGSLAQALCLLSAEQPTLRDEARYTAEEALRLAADHGSAPGVAGARAALHSLGVALPVPDTTVICEAPIELWIDALPDALPSGLRKALSKRGDADTQAAFAGPSTSDLTAAETALTRVRWVLLCEALRAGERRAAVGQVAALGGWALRRGLQWTDHQHLELVHALCWARILEQTLSVALDLGMALDDTPDPPRRPLSPAMTRWLDGREDEGHFSPDDVLGLTYVEPVRRAAAAAQVRKGLSDTVTDLAPMLPADVRYVLLAPPFLPPARLEDLAPTGRSLVWAVSAGDEHALAGVWRSSSGQPVWHAETVSSSKDESTQALVDRAQLLLDRLLVDRVERIAVAGRGLAGLIVSDHLRRRALDGPRVVSIPGADRRTRVAIDRSARATLVLLDDDPAEGLPCLDAVAHTLAASGVDVFRPGSSLVPDPRLFDALQSSTIVAISGHGHGASMLAPFIGNILVSELQQLPLQGARAGLCLACAAGDDTRPTNAMWDRDDPEGAAMWLMLAGAQAALDCVRPVPEVLAALLLEDMLITGAAIDDPERSFHDGLRGWRTWFQGLIEPCDEWLKGLCEPVLYGSWSCWLAERINAERLRRTGRAVVPIPASAIVGGLGSRPLHESSTSGPRRAVELMAPWIDEGTWSAFRWAARS